MFDKLLGRKFYSKCKLSIKLTKVRMEAIKKKRNAVEKYLRNDIADLLINGLDINAYGRAEGLLVELNMSSCYDLIEQFYGSISSQLSIMDNQKEMECPEECREAVASLMYAAARFADLPELRDLRNLFTQRYGNSMEAFVNKEFIEKLRSNPPTKDMKLQLLQDIAQDFFIEWNPKSLEQKLYTPPPPESDHPKKGSFKNTYDDGYKEHRSNAREYAASNQDEDDLPSPEEADIRQPFYSKFMPPPYFRPKATPPADSDDNEMPMADDKPKPRSVRRRNLKPPPGHDNNAGSSASDAAARTNSSGMRQGDAHKDEEEKLMDGLLLHYSKKPSPYETDKIKENLKPPPGRVKSLPPEPTMETKARKVPPRASSFEPDLMNSTGHVHPKLPDYDDLAARIAALSGR